MSKIIIREDVVALSTENQQELLRWRDWNPGLDNDHLTLPEVLSTMPKAPASAIPWQVKMIENDNWITAFPGAISLANHDCVHVLLGRGLLPQDEAFVIGFTMGASKKCKKWHYHAFRFLAKHWYPHPYAFSSEDLIAFDLGFERGHNSDAVDLEHESFSIFQDVPLRTARKILGIDQHQLRSVYRLEKSLLPSTKASRRLDTDWKGVDQSSMIVPDGNPLDKTQAVT